MGWVFALILAGVARFQGLNDISIMASVVLRSGASYKQIWPPSHFHQWDMKPTLVNQLPKSSDTVIVGEINNQVHPWSRLDGRTYINLKGSSAFRAVQAKDAAAIFLPGEGTLKMQPQQGHRVEVWREPNGIRRTSFSALDQTQPSVDIWR